MNMQTMNRGMNFGANFMSNLNDFLPGWKCECGCFNGEAKEVRKQCRACGNEREHDERYSAEWVGYSEQVQIAALELIEAWDADSAGHAMRCSPAMVGAMLRFKAIMGAGK